MKPNQIEGCKTIANYYGRESQILIVIEEMSELTKELCKHKRRYERRSEITEEIADVKIMLEQLIELFDAESDVDRIVDFKLRRQLRRIEQERGE